MTSPNASDFWSDTETPFADRRRSLVRRLGHLVSIISLLAVSSLVVYTTGGTGFAYPYVMLLPIILSAAWFGLLASVCCAVTGGLLLGPFMPLDVAQGTQQSVENWSVRIAFFLLISVFTGWLFQNLRKANQKHVNALRHDLETGLRNQSALKQDLKGALATASRDDTHKTSVVLILVRMQDLWEITEAMGADASGALMKSRADRIAGSMTPAHQIYRFSTSELAILFVAEAASEVRALSESIRGIGEEEVLINEVPLRVQLVAGCYLVENGTTADPDTVIKRARTGLFAAVTANVFFKFYDPKSDQQTAARVKLIAKVRSGLEKNQFELFYQPKICLKTGHHAGSEALLRWFDADDNLILPGLFMPKLESTSLIDPVTRFVIAQACHDIKSHGLAASSINFAVKNLMDPDLISQMGSTVSSYGVDPGLLEIEITEGALILDPIKARHSVESLINQGFKVSLDDFGTGYSSFQYLSNLPLTGLKIDRAFVTPLQTSADARTVLRSMIRMAHALDLEVTVEGVETPEQREMVSDFGADMVQGYLIARPLPVLDYVKWSNEYLLKAKIT